MSHRLKQLQEKSLKKKKIKEILFKKLFILFVDENNANGNVIIISIKNKIHSYFKFSFVNF